MLRNQDAEHLSQPSSGAPRVTPEELSAALAAIETRRQADAKTIPLDQAVSELHLDSTPDEIWAEVKTQREKASLPIAPVEQPQQAAHSLSVGTPVVRRRGWRRFFAPVLVIGVLMSTGVIPHSFTPHGFSPSLLTNKHFPTAAPILRPLSAIPVDQEVYADDFALIQISQGKPASQIVVSQNLTGNRWPVVKKDDHHLYVRGYIARADSLTDLQGKPLNLYNDDNSSELEGDKTSNLTLRVDDVPFQKTSGTDTFSGITIPNFQPTSLTTLTPGR